MVDSAISSAIVHIAVALIPFLLGAVLHEMAHGYMAYLQGDPTAKNAGRLTLNPIKHLDPQGTVMFVLTALLFPVIYGWAKPVPIDPRRFRRTRLGLFLVSIAGAMTNILLALVFAGLLNYLLQFYDHSVHSTGTSLLRFTLSLCIYGVLINYVLAVINLIPVPPLDGSKVVMSLLPRSLALSYARLERYGKLFILGLFLIIWLTNLFIYLIWPGLLLLAYIGAVHGLPLERLLQIIP